MPALALTELSSKPYKQQRTGRRLDGLICGNVRLVHVQEDAACGAKAEELGGREAAVDVAAERLHVDLVECRPQLGAAAKVPAGSMTQI